MYRTIGKRMLDVVLSIISILLLSPIMIAIYFLVLIFMGKPVFFKQKRPGLNNQLFTLWKFRTMSNKKDEDGNLVPDAKRLSKFGRILRSTSLDELPELFAILFNKMSFVGPRPMLIKDMVFFDNEIIKRQSVLPGLTGWAQVNGRNSLTWEERFKYDIYYSKKMSLHFDLKILFLTIKTVLKKEGIGESGGDLSIDYGEYLLKKHRITKTEFRKGLMEADKIENGYILHKDNNLVSIVMPSHNTGAYIKDSIESIQRQSYREWELIIVDDNSTDDTDLIVKPYLKDKRIKYIKKKKQIGAANARNIAINKAQGKYIAFLDSDDIWEKEKLKKQIKFMKDNNYYFTYTNYELIDEQSKRIGKLITGPKVITRRKMYDYCWPGCLTVVYDQEKTGKIQIKNLRKNNDYAIWLKVIEKANCHLLDENLAKYRKRQGSISNHNKISLIKYHYLLYREGQDKNVLESYILTIRNMVFGIIKKIIYIKSV